MKSMVYSCTEHFCEHHPVCCDDIIYCINYNVVFIVLFVKGVFMASIEAVLVYTRNPESETDANHTPLSSRRDSQYISRWYEVSARSEDL